MNPGSAEEWIDALGLLPHPEGGFFKETYRCEASLDQGQVVGLPKGASGIRSVSTGIYYLLRRGERSRLHRIASDEMWHFYAGSTLEIVGILPDGERRDWALGPEARSFQGVVPGGTWFGAGVRGSGDFALMGCTVAPGFDFKDFEMSDPRALLKRFPHHADVIEAFG